MPSAPDVSIVMSVYNGQAYVNDAISSILEQTLCGFEFIIVDDGSSDGTWRMLSALTDPRIRLLRNVTNAGLARSLNRGLDVAEGRYVARQDADDISAPSRIAQQFAFLEGHPDIGLVGTSYEIIDKHQKTLERISVATNNVTLQAQLGDGNPFVHGSTMFRRECVVQLGAYDPYIDVAQDYDLWLRIARQWQVANLPDALYKLRFHWESTSAQRAAKQLESARRIRRQIATPHSATVPASQPVDAGERSGPAIEADLLERYLWYSYLSFLADCLPQAVASMAELLSQHPYLLDTVQFADRLIGYAHRLAARNSDVESGARLISVVVSDATVPTGQAAQRQRKLLGEYYIGAMFLAHDGRDGYAARDCLQKAIQGDPSWLSKRGVLSVGLESLVGSRGARWLRRLV